MFLFPLVVCCVSFVVVSWLIGFLVSKFQSSEVSKFQSSKDSNIQKTFNMTEFPFHVFRKILISYRIFFKILLEGSADFFGARRSESCQQSGFPKFEISKNKIL